MLVLSADSGRELALQLASKLEKLERVSFAYERKLDYPGENYSHTLKAEVYIEFGRQFTPIQARFQATGSSWRQIFDGQTYFHQTAGKPAEDIALGPKANHFDSVSPLKNSIIGLAQNLRKLAGDTNQKFDSRAPNQFELKLSKREFSPAGLVGVGYDPAYTFTLDGKTGLPSKIVQHLANPKDAITTTFTDWNLEPVKRSAETWKAHR